MLIGAMTAFSTTIATGQSLAGRAGRRCSLPDCSARSMPLSSITLQADQVVSGLALTFLGTGISLVLGEGLSKAGTVSLLPLSQSHCFRKSRSSARSFSPTKVCWFISVICLCRWHGITSTARARACICARWANIPPRRMRLASMFFACAISMSLSAACWQVLAGATISLAVSPGWFSELTTGGQGWIAVGLVIFAQWDPFRAAVRCVCLWCTPPPHPGYSRSDASCSALTIRFITIRIWDSSCKCSLMHSRSSCW